MAASKSKSTFSFPRGPMSLVQAVREAESAILADYMADVNGIALEFRDASAAGLEPAKWASTLEDMVEKSNRVTYEREAKFGIMVSPNATAAFDEDYEVDVEEGIPWSELMYYAMRRDVVVALEAMGLDVEVSDEEEAEVEGEVEGDDADDDDSGDEEETDDDE